MTEFIFKQEPNKSREAFIYFTRPRGSYDQIILNCTGEDQKCIKNETALMNSTGNCSDCNSILISSIIQGVSYKCVATTIKRNFSNSTSNEYRFNTSM